MKVEELEFTIPFKNRKVKATCTKFKPERIMMYRVLIPGTKEGDEVYVFYENEKEKKLFWFELSDKKKQ